MKLPAALVMAVLVWSSSKYLPPYFLEMRKMDMVEQRFQLEVARQVVLLKEIRTQLQAKTQASAQQPDIEQRFY
jgi:hypothetical protein